MQLFKRKPKVSYEDFYKLQTELREVRHQLFPSEAEGWITVGWGSVKKDPNKFEQIEEKLNLLAKELNLEFSSIKGNYQLQKPETEPVEESNTYRPAKVHKVK